MRGVLVFMFATVSVIVMMLIGVTVLEPLTPLVTDSAAVAEGPVDGQSFVDRLLSAVFIWSPLMFLGVMLLWAVAWYHRREPVRRR